MTYAPKNVSAETAPAAREAFPTSISLVGLMGVGKTSIGRRLAPQLGLPFFDADVEIEAAAEMSIKDIFETYGEAEFRRLEQRVIERLLTGPACVLATGGGAYIQPDTRQAIENNSLSVWLDAEAKVLADRTKGRSHRPLLNQGSHQEVLTRLKAERDPIYAQAKVHHRAPGDTDEAGTAVSLLDQILSTQDTEA